MKNTIGLGIMGVVAAAVLLCGGLGGAGQVAEASGTPAETATLEMLADKIALKELVDTFSILADRKDGLAQEALFTPDAVVENYGGDGKLMTSLKGSKEIAKVYDDFLKTQDVVYHINGQQVVRIDGDELLLCRADLHSGRKEGQAHAGHALRGRVREAGRKVADLEESCAFQLD